MVTLKDVAREAGVSQSTASGALRGMGFVKPQTVKKVTAVAKRLDYKINVSASALRTGRTGVFGLVVPSLDIPYYGKMADALAIELSRQDLRLMVQVSQADPDLERKLISRSTGSMTDGLFILVNGLRPEDVSMMVGNSPTVLFESFGTNNPLNAVNTPGGGAMLTAVKHLYDQGYRRIGIVGQPTTDIDINSATSGSLLRHTRYRTTLSAIDELGLSDGVRSYRTSWGVEDGTAIAHRICNEGPLQCDAFLCLNDDLAIGLLRGLHECGITVPDDVGVMGFDGIAEGKHYVPSLSSIGVDFNGMAQTAVSLMQRQLEQDCSRRAMPQRVAVGYQLLPRESTMSVVRR